MTTKGRYSAMKPADRFEVIENWLKDRPQPSYIDIFDTDFAWHYIETTGVKAAAQHLGAPKCPQLGRDLSSMYRLGRLKRGRVGMPTGYASSGFPTWVYCYQLPAA